MHQIIDVFDFSFNLTTFASSKLKGLVFMPTYDYKCKECGITFELFQKMSDDPIKNCVECKGEVKRLIGSGLTPVFKGSGFYETDYKTKNNSSKKETKSVSSNSEKKSSKNVDSKKSA